MILLFQIFEVFEKQMFKVSVFHVSSSLPVDVRILFEEPRKSVKVFRIQFFHRAKIALIFVEIYKIGPFSVLKARFTKTFGYQVKESYFHS